MKISIQRFPPSSHSNNNQVAEKQKETQMQKSPRLLHLPTMLPPTTQAPLTVLPPPYPGPPTDLIYSEGATAGCPPPVGFNYPPVGLNYQGYPSPTNLAYPPSTGFPGAPAPGFAFPPNIGEDQLWSD